MAKMIVLDEQKVIDFLKTCTSETLLADTLRDREIEVKHIHADMTTFMEESLYSEIEVTVTLAVKNKKREVPHDHM